MSDSQHGHTYFFIPGRWGGKGTLSIIGGPTEQINLEMIISQSGTGIITAHMEVDFDETTHGGGVELVYTINANTPDEGFSFVQYNSQLGELSGEGSTTTDGIFLNYTSDDGAYGGFESLERIDEDNYKLRGTLSLNGMPSSVLEAAITKIPSQTI
jgi:hypothetical protein